MITNAAGRFHERAYDDFVAELYDNRYPHLWLDEGPSRPTYDLMSALCDVPISSKLRILDCACGTGVTYIPFTQMGFDIWGCDGSKRMLQCAANNCAKYGVSDNKLIKEPIEWTNSEAYISQFEECSFDFILVNGNSFCHLPSVAEYMQVALQNFTRLLRPGGHLLIDTKRYVRSPAVDGVQMFKELEYSKLVNEWVIRSERYETCNFADHGEVYFHTRVHYDLDPTFGRKICRGLIVISMYGRTVPSRVMLLPYYPLPANLLEQQMGSVGLATTLFAARTGVMNWRYDFVAGRRH